MGQETTDTKKSVSYIEELDDILARHMSGEELARARKLIRELVREGGEAQTRKVRDSLTGMYNRAGFLHVLEEWKQECVGAGKKLLFSFSDLDKLNTISHVYGQFEGDAAVQAFAMILEDCLGGEEICGYFGGGEFVVARRETGEEASAADIFEELEKGLETYNRVSGKEYSLHAVNCAVAEDVPAGTQMQTLLDDALLKKRQQDGGRRRGLGGADQEIDPDERRLVQRIIDNNEFRYAYQPIVDARTGEIYAYEALMRTAGEISLSPQVVLKYAELDGRFYDIEKATLFNVLEQLKDKDMGDRRIFINCIPGYELDAKDYRKLLERYGKMFSNIVVEITEQTQLTENTINELLKRSSADGFSVAIDDYGTGYSNLSSLLSILPNCVKIDRMLITDIQENPNKQHFVNDIITFCHENGILALAEGVETAAELKAVIQMGVDLIQGFYTARPDYELLEEIPKERREEIVSNNISLHDHTQRKIYIVNGERELPLMRLAMEQYTGLVVSEPELTLIGSPDYVAGMSIKIKDGCSCHITFKNVQLESIEDLPCIDVGKGSQLVLELDGSNLMEKVGIRVPDGSSCRIEGGGNLTIHARNIYGYGIGNDFNSGVGSITWNCSGNLSISTDGNQCICIGGGIYRQGEGLRFLVGSVELNVTGVEAIGIGCVEGDMPVEIDNCGVAVDFRVARGSAIGNWRGAQNLRMHNVKLEIAGSGSNLCGVGSPDSTSGMIDIRHAEVNIRLSGQTVWLLGNQGGSPDVNVECVSMKLVGEGNNLLGIGSYDGSASVTMRRAGVEIDLRAAEPVAIGAAKDACLMEKVESHVWINEDH